MKEKVLKMLSQREMSFEELERGIEGKGIAPALKEMQRSGLVFLNDNQNYAITLLGKIWILGLKDTYKAIAEQKDLFEFFKTRVPSLMPDELLSTFNFCNDLQIIGKPDLRERKKEIINKVFGVQPMVKKEFYISAPDFYRSNLMHIVAVLKEKPKIHILYPEEEYEKASTFIKVAQKFTRIKVKVIDPKDQYMGLVYINGKFSLFGFRTIENKPGWDALISTKDKECIEWVKENFDYMWDNLARKP
ncbi:MAG TPA: hypothetical protein ENI49_01140 [Thermoplasmatales archaeon]|nr:hypothetical protein [Thermoplasmatales archaeon]